ncbi:MAG: hypothetical protein ACRCX2_10195 [Paraclostridium sp.]
MREDIGGQEFTEISEIPIFNVIGEYAKQKYYDVTYFKVLLPKLKNASDTFTLEFDYKYLYYVQAKEEGSMVLSIYYDDCDLGGVMGRPYYELHDGYDIERFLETCEDEVELFDKAKELLR